MTQLVEWDGSQSSVVNYPWHLYVNREDHSGHSHLTLHCCHSPIESLPLTKWNLCMWTMKVYSNLSFIILTSYFQRGCSHFSLNFPYFHFCHHAILSCCILITKYKTVEILVKMCSMKKVTSLQLDFLQMNPVYQFGITKCEMAKTKCQRYSHNGLHDIYMTMH